MKTVVAKWGNSLVIRIPQTYAEHLGLSEGSVVEVSTGPGVLVIRQPGHTLQELLKGITPENTHSAVEW